MILESVESGQIRFVFLLCERDISKEYGSAEGKDQQDDKEEKLRFEQLGLEQRKPDSNASIVKTCTVQG